MRFMEWAADGGEDSGVRGFYLLELKPLFSVVVLKFRPGGREAYHSHAFNALTWWIKGEAEEIRLQGATEVLRWRYRRSWKPKITTRDNTHKVFAFTDSWAISLRGPWKNTWYEVRRGEKVTLTNGRKVTA